MTADEYEKLAQLDGWFASHRLDLVSAVESANERYLVEEG